MSIVLEVCIDSVEAAIAAQQGGAHRVELCADLLEGGTTPSAGTIQLARRSVDGVVIGILNEDGSVDEERTRELVELARPMSVTFHRAFDMARDPYAALDTLINLGVNRVLTSGQDSSVLEGLDLITDLVRVAGDRIIIMPGGGVTERNFEKIVKTSGVREVHFVASATREIPMAYRNPNCFMGGELRPPEFSLTLTDPDRVGAFVRAAQGI